MRNLNDVRAMMEAVGIPGRDAYHLPTSGHTFPDGGHYRMEISGIERPQVLAALIDEMHKRQIAIHRLISVVMGSSLLDDAELHDFAQMAAAARQVIMTPGPRSGWDVGRQLVTPEGGLSGCAFAARISSATSSPDLRLVDLGFRGFLAIDEGCSGCSTSYASAGTCPPT